MGYEGDESVSTRASAFRSGGASVVSFGTAKSALSKLSKKSNCTIDAVVVSQATAQAVQAAKAILNAGGSELTALKTAKAAAVSALMPESGENEVSGIGSSFLRRRKMKRQAEVVASMALASAMASCQAGVSAIGVNNKQEWDHVSGVASLEGLKLVNGGTNSLTLSSRDSGSTSGERGASKPCKRRQTTAEMISSQLRMLPSLAATFSGGDGGITRQTSTFSYDTHAGSAHTSLPTPTNMRPRIRHRHQTNENCSGNNLFANHSGCGIDHGYSDDLSTASDLFSHVNPVDSMLMSIASAFSCGLPPVTHRPREVRVPIVDEADEADDYDEDEDEETITFTSERNEVEEKTKPSVSEALVREAVKQVEEGSLEADVPAAVPNLTISISKSTLGDASIGANSDQILEDLLASTPTPGSQSSGKFPAVITSERNTIELEVQQSTASLDELIMEEIPEEEPEEYDENANYVQIVAPQKRSRRLARGYKKLGALTPMSLQAKVGSPPADASKGKPSMFRKKWRK